jgi:hypothetical protein
MIAEAPGEGLVLAGHRHLGRRLRAAGLGSDRCRAVADRDRESLLNLRDLRVGTCKRHLLGRRLPKELVPLLPLRDEDLARFGGGETNFRGKNCERKARVFLGTCAPCKQRRE